MKNKKLSVATCFAILVARFWDSLNLIDDEWSLCGARAQETIEGFCGQHIRADVSSLSPPTAKA
jgi:hypothetical protein